MGSREATFRIGTREIGAGGPVYVVAELSANHRGSFDEAVAIVRAARDAGADAVKLQTYTADTITIPSEDEPFRAGSGSPWAGRTLHDLYAEACTPWDWQPKLQQLAHELGLELFSSPFDPSAVDFLEAMHVPAYKVASFELVDLPLIRRIAATRKPMILSTGMATLDEVEEAVGAAREAGGAGIALLKCTSAYPTPPGEMNLRTIPALAERFGVPVGLSDHSLGIAAPVAAVSLGAAIVEKHLTLSRAAGGPDASFSLEPGEFAAMVREIRFVERALGEVRFAPTEREAESRRLRRSLYVVRDVKAGEAFSAESVRSIRPAAGLPPKHLAEILGRRARRAIAAGTPLAWDLVE